MTASEIIGDADTDLEIIECGITLLSERAPMGKVIGGKLCARGFLVPGSSIPDHELWGAGTFQNVPDVALKLDCHAAGDKTAIMKAMSCHWLRVRHEHGLVLEHLEGNVYKHIGYVMCTRWLTHASSIKRTYVDIM
ncbi:hypothetical protein CSAL01_02008 [Colletotrichum salicis]|uniref:Uncharacterized protein n=1 Tax=Colletotrichum salicis TaxID=1209931 RepID=A0A135TCK0_9PEZI|nr:hypothetical protein CSAL01_02008 [Colletotrichum salicis]